LDLNKYFDNIAADFSANKDAIFAIIEALGIRAVKPSIYYKIFSKNCFLSVSRASFYLNSSSACYKDFYSQILFFLTFMYVVYRYRYIMIIKTNQ